MPLQLTVNQLAKHIADMVRNLVKYFNLLHTMHHAETSNNSDICDFLKVSDL